MSDEGLRELQRRVGADPTDVQYVIALAQAYERAGLVRDFTAVPSTGERHPPLGRYWVQVIAFREAPHPATGLRVHDYSTRVVLSHQGEARVEDRIAFVFKHGTLGNDERLRRFRREVGDQPAGAILDVNATTARTLVRREEKTFTALHVRLVTSREVQRVLQRTIGHGIIAERLALHESHARNFSLTEVGRSSPPLPRGLPPRDPS